MLSSLIIHMYLGVGIWACVSRMLMSGLPHLFCHPVAGFLCYWTQKFPGVLTVWVKVCVLAFHALSQFPVVNISFSIC